MVTKAQHSSSSFVLVLGVSVIVTGGSVSRVAAVEKRDEEYGKLGPTAAFVQERIGAIATELATRAASFSPRVAERLRRGNVVSGIALRSGEEMYRHCGYAPMADDPVVLEDGVVLECTLMEKKL